MSTPDAKTSKWKEAGALEVLTLGLDGHIFALEAAYVREILDLGPVTEVPSADPFVNGLSSIDPEERIRSVQVLRADPVFDYFWNGRAGRHAPLANFEPQVGALGRVVGEKSRTAVGTIPWGLAKPQELVTCPVGRNALSSKSGRVLQKPKESGGLSC